MDAIAAGPPERRWPMTPQEARDLERLRHAQSIIERQRAAVATAFGARVGLPPGTPLNIDLVACEWVAAGA